MPIEIGPDGSPIVTPATVPTDNGAAFIAPTSESLHPSVDTPTDGTSDEGTDRTDSTDGKESKEVEPKAPGVAIDDEQDAQIREVLRYACSDSQAADKAYRAIQLILAKKAPKVE